MKILLLASQHGDELLGEKLYAYIKKSRPRLLTHLSYSVGNPLARKQRVRFIESDLNRSYVAIPQTYEETIAAAIMSDIKQNEYDLVLDLHTTRAQQPPCMIVFTPNETAQCFIAMSAINYVVVMKKSIAVHSLIGNADNAVSIEVEDRQLNSALYSALCDDLERFINSTEKISRKTYYEVFDFIRESDFTSTELQELRNFKKSRHGFYPVLANEPSYATTTYRGFKARAIPKLKEKDTL